MTFWTFMLLLAMLGGFGIAQGVKVLNSDTRAGDLARAFARSIIDRISRQKDTPTDSSEKK